MPYLRNQRHPKVRFNGARPPLHARRNSINAVADGEGILNLVIWWIASEKLYFIVAFMATTRVASCVRCDKLWECNRIWAVTTETRRTGVSNCKRYLWFTSVTLYPESIGTFKFVNWWLLATGTNYWGDEGTYCDEWEDGESNIHQSHQRQSVLLSPTGVQIVNANIYPSVVLCL